MITILPYNSEKFTDDYELFSYVYLHGELEDTHGYDLCLIKPDDLKSLNEGITEVLVEDEKCLLFFWRTQQRQRGLIIYPNSTSYSYCLECLNTKTERL